MSRRRQRHVGRTLVILSGLLVSLLALYLFLYQQETGQSFNLGQWLVKPKDPVPQFQAGNAVALTKTAAGQDQLAFRQRVGQVLSSRWVEPTEGEPYFSYEVAFSSEERLTEVAEADLRAIAVPFELGQSVGLVNGQALGEYGDGQIEAIHLLEGDQPTYSYEASFPSLGYLTDLTQADLIWIKALALDQAAAAPHNQQVLKSALEQSKAYAAARLDFPEGQFLMGSDKPLEDYLELTSNLELRGHGTTLLVEDTLVFLGLTTGPGAWDGVSNFIMQGLHIQAADVTAGAHFTVMANHGSNWQVFNNRFSQVHAMSSHIFDLGGLQDSIFDSNSFEGYAPNLTQERQLGNWTPHNLYSEAIQLDASSDNGEWDGGILQKIDPNYKVNNPERLLSNNITITNNQFIPYYDEAGQVLAYGATIGQHSSEVGQVTIANNVFRETLASRFVDQVQEPERWVMEPIHIRSKADNAIYGNIIE